MSQVKLNLGTEEKQNEIIEILEEIRNSKDKRYTVRIDKGNSNPSNRITYMHDAEGMTPAHMNFSTGAFDYGDWKDIWFIKGNYPVMLKYDGTVDYKLNPNDYTKKEDGTASDIANTSYGGNAMARFPKVYLSFTEDENYEYISVSDVKYDRTYEPIGFINDNGEEVNEIFLAMFDPSNISSKLRSLSGQTPMTNQTHNNEVSYARANGTGWYVGTWAQRQMVNALLIIISKSDNSQAAFGYGNCDASTYAKINTGTLNNKGQFFGYSSSDKTKAVKVFHIENWWGNMYKRIAGLVAYQGKVYAKMSGPYNTPGETNTSGYTQVLTYDFDMGNGYAVNCKCNNAYGRLPISSITPTGGNGSSSTYLCDFFSIDYDENDFYYPIVGSYYGGGEWCGISALFVSSLASESFPNVATVFSYMP